MVCTQVQLPESQFRALRAAAAQRGVSMAELIRQALTGYLDTVPQCSGAEMRARAIAAAGCGNSGLGDLAEEHDRYLEEAFGSWSSS